MNRRQIGLIALAGLLAVLVLKDYPSVSAAGESERTVASPVAKIAPGDALVPRGTRTAQADPLIDLPRRRNATSQRDAFAPHSWAPPPPPAAKPQPAPPPQAPPPPPPPSAPALTLVYLGQMDVAGEATVYYLAQGERVLAVSVGDTIDGVYRVLAPEGRALALLYLPLNIKQLLPMKQAPS